MLEVEHLCKDYYIDKTPFRALSDITVSFPTVQFVSVLGPSGCGKTTLLNILGGLDNLTSGDVKVDGRSLKDMSEKELDSYRNNYIGFVFQNCYLIPQLNVLENVRVALEVRDYSEAEGEKKAKEALEQVGMLDYEKKRPNQLSGGQAQRVAIARSLVTDPKIILADEPTGALDSENSRLVLDLLKEISKTRLIILVTHNEELAEEYSDRILRMKDGKIISDETKKEPAPSEEAPKELKKSHLSFRQKLKLSLHNLSSRRGKTILNGIANSFGMIGIGFLLAINTGFGEYSNRISEASASSLPVVVSAYNEKTSSEAFADKNASVAYTDAQEIYPSVETDSQYSYVYNNFSPKYFSYLDSLQEQGIVREYTLSYGNSYDFNLTTEFPDSLDGETEGGLAKVNTSMTSWSYYAYISSLPYNLFHVLYGNLDEYDLIAGEMPTGENDLVLVVDRYNGVDFDILQSLGFYNSADQEADVEDPSLDTKVKPISFDDVIGKTYKVFTDTEYYSEYDVTEVTDALGSTRQVTRYKANELTDEFYSSNGTELKITGILRPKENSSFSLLSPSLCYLPSLQEKLMAANEESPFAQTLPDNVVFKKPDDLEDGTTVAQGFVDELNAIYDSYTNSDSTVLPTEDLNNVIERYFNYYSFYVNPSSQNAIYIYSGLYTFLYDAKNHSSDLVAYRLLGQDLSDQETLSSEINQLSSDLLSGDTEAAYDDIISLVAYANAYSLIQAVVIFPTNLENRSILLTKLDEFNEIDGNPEHATSTSEQVYYVTTESAMVEDVGTVISLVTDILVIFAAIAITVAAAVTALMTTNNVLERKKEIGLLRSLGSRKSDVVWIFLLESLFIGLLAGLLSSLLTYVLCFPINQLLVYYYPRYNTGNICNFTWYHALIVIGASMLIAFIASLIPALKAAKEDPAKALKSED